MQCKLQAAHGFTFHLVIAADQETGTASAQFITGAGHMPGGPLRARGATGAMCVSWTERGWGSL